MNDDFDFYIEIGQNFLDIGSNDDFEITNLWITRSRIVILDNIPHIAADGKEYPYGTVFELYICNNSYMAHTATSTSSFMRYVIFLKNLRIQRLKNYIKILAAKCAERGRIWDSFHEYASFPMDEAMWAWPDTPDPKLVIAYMPKMVWHFERGPNAVVEGATMYDERVVVTTTWTYDGKEHSFTGYWYVTSVAFVCQRLETTDPYYRRYMLLGHSFQLEHLKQTLSKELKTFTIVDPACREDYLKHHFEYEGLPNFYER